MRIRVINQNDWEKNYEFDKSIIRIGSQFSCDVVLIENDIQPLQMQLVRTSEKEALYVMRFFGDNISITRGGQTFPGEKITPYDLLDGDKISFSNYRLLFSLDDEKTRVRSSSHIEAELFLPRRNLSLGDPITGVINLKNLGEEKPCQFRMSISGIPKECVQFSPLPYLFPGGSSSVGFVITHLQTIPEPGFHTVSITLNAPDDYFGEVLEFNQDIYVDAVFKNQFALVDDSPEVYTESKENREKNNPPESDKTYSAPPEKHNDLFNLEDASSIDHGKPEIPAEPIVMGSSDADDPTIFASEEDDEPETNVPLTSRQKRQRMVVIRHDEDNKNVFGDDDEYENEDEDEDENGYEYEITPEDSRKIDTVPETPDPVPEETKPEKRFPDLSAPVEEDDNDTDEDDTSDFVNKAVSADSVPKSRSRSAAAADDTSDFVNKAVPADKVVTSRSRSASAADSRSDFVNRAQPADSVMASGSGYAPASDDSSDFVNKAQPADSVTASGSGYAPASDNRFDFLNRTRSADSVSVSGSGSASAADDRFDFVNRTYPAEEQEQSGNSYSEPEAEETNNAGKTFRNDQIPILILNPVSAETAGSENESNTPAETDHGKFDAALPDEHTEPEEIPDRETDDGSDKADGSPDDTAVMPQPEIENEAADVFLQYRPERISDDTEPAPEPPTFDEEPEAPETETPEEQTETPEPPAFGEEPEAPETETAEEQTETPEPPAFGEEPEAPETETPEPPAFDEEPEAPEPETAEEQPETAEPPAFDEEPEAPEPETPEEQTETPEPLTFGEEPEAPETETAEEQTETAEPPAFGEEPEAPEPLTFDGQPESEEKQVQPSSFSGKGKKNIRVIHQSTFGEMADFFDESIPAPEENKKPVKIMKGGQFDE